MVVYYRFCIENIIRIRGLIGVMFSFSLFSNKDLILKTCRRNIARIRVLIDFYMFSVFKWFYINKKQCREM